MKANIKFRLGLLDGLKARQEGRKIDTAKLFKVKGPDYAQGYSRGLTSIYDTNKEIEEGNKI